MSLIRSKKLVVEALVAYAPLRAALTGLPSPPFLQPSPTSLDFEFLQKIHARKTKQCFMQGLMRSGTSHPP